MENGVRGRGRSNGQLTMDNGQRGLEARRAGSAGVSRALGNDSGSAGNGFQ
jgi:hypothetical protein